MAVKLLYFAWVREKIGRESEELNIPEAVTTPSELMDWLSAKGGGYSESFADRSKMRCAVDQVMTSLDSSMGKPTEIAFFPPVTGG